MVAQNPVGLPKTDVWTKIKDLNLKFTLELDRPCLFLYNIALPANNLIATRLTLDGQPLLTSLKAEKSNAYAGLMGLGSKIVGAGGERVLTVEYMSKASNNAKKFNIKPIYYFFTIKWNRSNFKIICMKFCSIFLSFFCLIFVCFNTKKILDFEIKPSSDDWQSAGISMLELPITTIIHEKFLDGVVSIVTDDWNLLGNLKLDLKMELEKNCLVFYAVSSTMPLST